MRTALITGASQGLGRELALAFLGAGYRVALNYLTSEKSARDIAGRYGTSALAIKADVGIAAEAAGMIALIGQEFGRLDILVNNAGITLDRLLIRQSEEEWDAVIRTNLTGCFNTIRAAAPVMIESGGGHIINISSYSAIKGSAGQAAYSASKSGLLGLTISAARELAGHNIRVNAVLPGYMKTAMGEKAAQAMVQAKQESLLHALSDPAEAAQYILSVAGLQRVTGQVFSLDSRIL